MITGMASVTPRVFELRQMNDQQPPRNKLSPGAAIFLAGVLAQIGFYLLEVPTDSAGDYSGRAGITLFLVIVMALFAMPACGLLALAVWWLNKRGWWPRWCQAHTLLIVGTMLPLLGFVIGLSRGTTKAHYAAHVGVLEDRISDIQVSGFSGFLASRWLFSFSIMPDDAATIASKLGLKEDNSTKLKEFLANDAVLLHSPVSAALHTANPGDLKTYSLIQPEDMYSRWIILTVDARHHRAWLYRGFQN